RLQRQCSRFAQQVRFGGAGELRLHSFGDECARESPRQRARQGRVRERLALRDVREVDHQLRHDACFLPEGIPRSLGHRGAAAGRRRSRPVRQVGSRVAVNRVRTVECGVRNLTWKVGPTPRRSVMKRVSFALLTLAAVAPLQAQSLLYRPPNLGGTWVPDGGVVQFNFVHRFYVTPGPSHSVINFPNFTLAAGFGHQAAFGAHFATRSIVGLGNGALSTNETEVYGRWRVHGVEAQPGFAVAVTPAYNLLAKSVDGEVGVDWTQGPFTLHGAARAVSRRLGQSGDGAAAFAGGFHARLKPDVARGASGAAVAAEVDMTAIKFAGDAVTISAGQAVRWTNRDPLEHTVTFDGAEPGSPPIPPNGSYVHRFDRPGTYTYHCTPHPFMKG